MTQSCQGGAVVQLVAIGLADAVLTGKPLVTFWRFVHKPYTNFSLETQVLDFTAGVPNFGSSPKCNLDRIGDLVYYMYLVADLPGIGLEYPKAAPTSILNNSDDAAGDLVEPYWTQAVGQALIESTTFFIGGQCIDQIYSEFLFIWEELTGQPGKRLVEMTGNYRSVLALQVASRQPRRLYVPLPYWFTMNSGMALPIVSLQFHSVAVSVNLRDHMSLLKLPYKTMNVGVNGVAADKYTLTDIKLRPEFLPQNSQAVQSHNDLQPLAANSLNAFIEVCYVFLEQRERSQFADGAFEQLFLEHQNATTSVDQSISGTNAFGSDKTINFELNFNHPIVELFWVARLGIHEKLKTVAVPEFNEWFNFGGPLDQVTEVPIDPVKKVALRLNNAYRFGPVEGRYFRLVTPYQFHTNIPIDHIYSYSFALQPEDIQPSGSCNFSRIDNTKMEITFDGRNFVGPRNTSTLPTVNIPLPEPDASNPSENSTLTFMVFATNWNILRFKFGLSGKRFAN